MLVSIEQLNGKADKIKTFITTTFSNRLKMPVYISDDISRVIALANYRRRGDTDVWLNGKPEKLENLALEINLVYRKNPSSVSEMKRNEQDGE